jgi:hypothetical protein
MEFLSTIPTLYVATNKLACGYKALNGTSQATPLVAATAALILARHPKMKPQEVRNHIVNSGNSISALMNRTISGRRLNVLAALKSSENIMQRAKESLARFTVALLAMPFNKDRTSTALLLYDEKKMSERPLSQVNQNDHMYSSDGTVLADSSTDGHQLVVRLKANVSIDDLKSDLSHSAVRLDDATSAYNDPKTMQITVKSKQPLNSVIQILRQTNKLEDISENVRYDLQ